MILCLVTDRRRLGAAAGAGPADWMAALETQVAAAAAAGVDLVQVREPDLEAAELSRLVRSLLSLTAATSTRIIVNDRLDVAIATGAAGVHLKERSFSAEAVRQVSPKGLVIGRSTHDVAGAASAGAVDYLIAGTVLPTVSKPSAAHLGWSGLSSIVRAARQRPVLAIGGIDLPSIPFVAATGSAGVAAIGAFLPEGSEGIAEFVQKRVIAMRLGFDSAHPVS